MLGASNGYGLRVSAGGRPLPKATLTLADGTVRELTGDDLMAGTLSVTRATSRSGSFDVGGAVIGSCELALNNRDGRFDLYDFTGATLAPYVGYELASGTEWLRMGTYRVEQPARYGNTISLSALDSLSLMQRPYSGVSTAYPATLATIVRDACAACGVTLATPTFANSSYVVPARPDDSSLSCLDALSFAAQAAGCWVRCDQWGAVALGWYSQRTMPRVVSAVSGLSVATDMVRVTGVRVTASDQVLADGGRGADGEAALSGEEGYVLDVAGNPFVAYGQAAAVAAQVASQAVGLVFWPMDFSMVGDPRVEAGDFLGVMDASGRDFYALVTSVTYKVGARTSVSCSAETPARRSATVGGSLTRALVANKEAVRAERTARERAVADLREMIEEGDGLYQTIETLQDGSKVYYLHDRPTVGESRIVWRMNAQAIAVSTDGGETWATGITADGDAVLRRIYAIGLDADYINAGRIAVTRTEDGQTVTIMEIDIDTGQVTLRSLDGLNVLDLLAGTMSLNDLLLRTGLTIVPVDYEDTKAARKLTLDPTGIEMSYHRPYGTVKDMEMYSWCLASDDERGYMVLKAPRLDIVSEIPADSYYAGGAESIAIRCSTWAGGTITLGQSRSTGYPDNIELRGRYVKLRAERLMVEGYDAYTGEFTVDGRRLVFKHGILVTVAGGS